MNETLKTFFEKARTTAGLKLAFLKWLEIPIMHKTTFQETNFLQLRQKTRSIIIKPSNQIETFYNHDLLFSTVIKGVTLMNRL